MSSQAERKYELATALWETYVERYPDEGGGAHANYAVCLLNSDRPQEGLSQARKAYRLSPVAGNHWVLMEALAANGLVKELKREAEAHTDSDPGECLRVECPRQGCFHGGRLRGG